VLTTVTTVGYGDHFPTTGTGRFVAVGLMFAGIALVGVVTATFASWLVQRVQETEDRREASSAADVVTLAESALRRWSDRSRR